MLHKLKKLIQCYNDEMTPLPKIIVSIGFFLTLFQAMTLTTVFSYLPKFVKSFGTSETNIGLYAGFVASFYFVGTLIFSSVWGYIVDVKGIKFTSIVCATCLSLATLAFGFSYNFYWALITRLLQGCSMGMLVITKSLIGNNCDESNVAYAMSIIMSSYSIGLSVGPSLAGFLVFPAEHYPNVFNKDGIFGKFCVLLPNAILSLGLLILIIFIVYFLPTVKKNVVNERSCLIDSKCQNKKYMEWSRDKHTDLEIHTESYFNLSFERAENTERRQKREDLNHENQNLSNDTKFKGPKKIYERLKKSRICKVLRNKWCMTCCLLNGFYIMGSVGYEEMFPLFTATSHVYKGVEFSPANIGTVLLIGAFIMTILQLSLQSIIFRKFGAKNIFIWGNVIFSIALPLMPITGKLENNTGVWIILLIFLVITRTANYAAFISIHILINNSIDSRLLGSANGVCLSIASLGGSVAPALFGSIYSWSMKNIKGVKGNENALGFPCNQYFTFIVLSVIMLCISFFASRLPVTLNHSLQVVDETSEMEISDSSQTTNVTISMFEQPV